VSRVSLPEDKSPTRFLVGCHHLQDLEEFTLKIKCGPERNTPENFHCLIDFLSAQKTLKKLCLQFDGIQFTFDLTKKLFNQIAKLQTLVSFDIEFLNFKSLDLYAQRDLKVILNRLPAHVNKKCIFSRPIPQ